LKGNDNTTKRMNVAILWWPTRKAIKWSDSMKNSEWLNVHKVNNSRDSFNPKLRNRGGKQQSPSSLKKVTMLMLSNTILSVITSARVQKKSALLRKKLMKRMR
jgi:hypothetical protein